MGQMNERLLEMQCSKHSTQSMKINRNSVRCSQIFFFISFRNVADAVECDNEMQRETKRLLVTVCWVHIQPSVIQATNSCLQWMSVVCCCRFANESSIRSDWMNWYGWTTTTFLCSNQIAKESPQRIRVGQMDYRPNHISPKLRIDIMPPHWPTPPPPEQI